MDVHSITLKGFRPQNEDMHNIIINGDGKDCRMSRVNFFSVFDGHGGKAVSHFLEKQLHPYFVNPKVTYPLTKKYVYNVFNHVQKILRTNHKDFALHTGSTSLVVIHFRKNNQHYLNVLNTGDCRCVLSRDNIGLRLTKDHKPDKPEERRRIEKLGGKIYFDGDDWRIKDLSVSRAFGDLEATPFLTHIPDIYRYRLDKGDKFFIIACDGLWDVVSDQDAVDFVLNTCYDKNFKYVKNKKVNVARKLAEYALSKGSTDNITAIVVFLN